LHFEILSNVFITIPLQPFKKFADEAKEGFIIFSLGTIVHGNNMPQETFDTFFRVFSKLNQRVIWRWEGKRPDKIPSHIMMADWIPQQDLLGMFNHFRIVRKFYTI